MKTTRQHFGTTLSLLARLYKFAESRGDTRRAKLYAIAVDAMLEAWPSEGELDAGPFEGLASGAWSRRETTLIGLGVLPEGASAAGQAS